MTTQEHGQLLFHEHITVCFNFLMVNAFFTKKGRKWPVDSLVLYVTLYSKP